MSVGNCVLREHFAPTAPFTISGPWVNVEPRASNVVGVATRYGLEGLGFELPGREFFRPGPEWPQRSPKLLCKG
jgi:hypothetical protein